MTKPVADADFILICHYCLQPDVRGRALVPMFRNEAGNLICEGCRDAGADVAPDAIVEGRER